MIIFPPLKHRSYCLLMMCLGFILAACTGTTEERLPTLLAVSLVQNDEPQVALIETVLASDGTYTLLEDSRRPLPAPAKDFSVTGRRGERGELVVLSRADDNETYLDFFSLRSIDPADPQNFKPVADKPRLALSTFEDAEGGFCAEALQISNSGRYAAIFNGTDGCQGIDEPTIDVLDLREERVLERITGGTFGLVTATPYIDQRTDALFYLTQGVNQVNLIRLNLANLSKETFAELDAENENNIAQYASDISRQGDTLLILRSAEIVALPLSNPENPLSLSTTSGSKRFVDNLVEASTNILTLTSRRLTVHRSLEDEDEGSADLDSLFGTLEAVEGFAYFPLEGAIRRFDLLRYRSSSAEVSSLLRTYSVPELTTPGPITHLKGILPETSTQ